MILFTNGCSNTYGGGLEPHFVIDNKFDHSKRLESVWPHHLGKLLNADKVVNLAEGCGSNQRIVRTTFDWFMNDFKKNQKAIAVIQLTDPARYEYYLTNDFSDFENHDSQWTRLTPSAHVINQLGLERLNLNYRELEPKITKERDSRMLTYTLIEGMYKTISQVSALVHLFERHNVEYHFFGRGFTLYDSWPVKYKQHMKDLNFIDTHRENWQFDKVSIKDTHPSVLGHKQIADLLYQRIRPKQIRESI
jgi:hypothetical protein